MEMTPLPIDKIRFHGDPVVCGFADYLISTAHEVPNFEIVHMHTPNAKTPTGTKGMAEGGVMGSIGVVADRQPLNPQYIRSLRRGNSE